MIREKIEALKSNIIASEAGIENSKSSIEDMQKEIAYLEELNLKLQKIYQTKLYLNLGNTEAIAQLANKITVSDFLNKLQDVLDFHIEIHVSDLPLSRLTVYQILFLLYDDLSVFNKPTSPEDSEGRPDQEITSKNSINDKQ